MAGFSPVGSAAVAAIGGNSGTFYPRPGGIVFAGSNVTTNQVFLAPGRLVLLGVTPAAVLAAPRVTWTGVEALHDGDAPLRATWIGIEVLRGLVAVPTDWVATWIGTEITHDAAAAERAAWIGAEVANDGDADNRVTWIGVEVLRSKRELVDSGWVCLIAA